MKKHIIFSAFTLFFLALACGCAGSAKPNEPIASQGAKPAPKDRPALAAAAAVKKSMFTIDQNSRDPFFPRKKAAPTETLASTSSNTSGPATAEIPALLSAGLQGIGGTADRRIAVIHNVILETGRSAVIAVHAGNNSRSLAVRCRDISRDAVTLDVEGYGPVVLSRKQIL